MNIKSKKDNYPLCSIIIPCYNSEKTIDRCIRSCLNQTYNKIEVIIVNDGSNDKTLEICNMFKLLDDRIKIYSQINRGVSSARNRGLQESSGEYIVFLDSDDSLKSNCIEKMMYFQEYDWVIMGYESCYDNKTVLIAPKDKELHCKLENFNELFSKDCFQYICVPVAKLYKGSIIRQNKILFNLELDFGEDTCFNIDYIKCIENCVMCSQGIYTNYTREGGLSRRYVESCWRTLDYITQKYINTFNNYENNENYRYYLGNIVLRNLKISIGNVVSYSNWDNFCLLIDEINLSDQVRHIKKDKLNYKERIIIFCITRKIKTLLYILFKIRV